MNTQDSPAVGSRLDGGVRPLCDRLRDAACADSHLRDEAADKLEKMDALLRGMQADAMLYLVPDNDCGADWFVRRMLWHLDGPAQREAQGGVANG